MMVGSWIKWKSSTSSSLHLIYVIKNEHKIISSRIFHCIWVCELCVCVCVCIFQLSCMCITIAISSRIHCSCFFLDGWKIQQGRWRKKKAKKMFSFLFSIFPSHYSGECLFEITIYQMLKKNFFLVFGFFLISFHHVDHIII